jgi:hypothetical protein
MRIEEKEKAIISSWTFFSGDPKLKDKTGITALKNLSGN